MANYQNIEVMRVDVNVNGQYYPDIVAHSVMLGGTANAPDTCMISAPSWKSDDRRIEALKDQKVTINANGAIVFVGYIQNTSTTLNDGGDYPSWNVVSIRGWLHRCFVGQSTQQPVLRYYRKRPSEIIKSITATIPEAWRGLFTLGSMTELDYSSEPITIEFNGESYIDALARVFDMVGNCGCREVYSTGIPKLEAYSPGSGGNTRVNVCNNDRSFATTPSAASINTSDDTADTVTRVIGYGGQTTHIMTYLWGSEALNLLADLVTNDITQVLTPLWDTTAAAGLEAAVKLKPELATQVSPSYNPIYYGVFTRFSIPKEMAANLSTNFGDLEVTIPEAKIWTPKLGTDSTIENDPAYEWKSAKFTIDSKTGVIEFATPVLVMTAKTKDDAGKTKKTYNIPNYLYVTFAYTDGTRLVSDQKVDNLTTFGSGLEGLADSFVADDVVSVIAGKGGKNYTVIDTKGVMTQRTEVTVLKTELPRLQEMVAQTLAENSKRARTFTATMHTFCPSARLGDAVTVSGYTANMGSDAKYITAITHDFDAATTTIEFSPLHRRYGEFRV